MFKKWWLLLVLVVAVAVPVMLIAQDTDEDADIEVVLAPVDGVAAASAWPVCVWGHWVRGGGLYPPPCTRQHIDALVGPLAPCSRIQIGGKWYHIRRVVKLPNGGYLITVKRI